MRRNWKKFSKKKAPLCFWSFLMSAFPPASGLLFLGVIVGAFAENNTLVGVGASLLGAYFLSVATPLCGLTGIILSSLALRKGEPHTKAVIALVLASVICLAGGYLAYLTFSV